jgi:hypothetical protein
MTLMTRINIEWVFRPGPHCEEKPGLKSETWATHLSGRYDRRWRLQTRSPGGTEQPVARQVSAGLDRAYEASPGGTAQYPSGSQPSPSDAEVA